MAVTTSNGNGFALYNGEKLPNIDSVWTGELKETHPYAYIDVIDLSTLGLSGIFANFNAFSKSAYQEQYTHVEGPFKRISYAFASNDEAATAIGLSAAGEWVLLGEEDVLDNTIASFGPATWTNHDILNADNSVYLAASDPIPLDGMNVIEWDGFVSGDYVTVIDNGYYVQRVGDYLPSDVYGGFVVSGYMLDEQVSFYGTPIGSYVSVPDGYSAFANILPDDSWLITASGGSLGTSNRFVLSAAGVLEEDSIRLDRGLWLPVMKGNGGNNAIYTSLVAYRSAETPPEDDGGDESTALKHYCRVNGSIYEVEGGVARISGSYHEIEVGTVRIEGAYYEIPFSGGSEGGGGGEEGGGSLDGVIFQAGEGLLQGTVTATPNNPSFTSVISYSVTDSYITTKGGNVQQTVGGNTVYIPAFYTLTIGPFDATDYDTLHVELTSNIGVIKCESGTDSVTSGVITNSATAEEVTLDISGLSGECNVVIAPSGNITSSTIFNATIYKIWLT